MEGKERKAFQVDGGMIHGELENSKENVGFRAQNMQKEESLKRWLDPRSLSTKLWNLNYLFLRNEWVLKMF